MTISEIQAGLKQAGYIANTGISSAVSGTINYFFPLLVEGDPGTGKTYLAKAVADMLGAELIRVQVYEGMSYDKILYDYDYQRQLLTIEAMRSTLDTLLKRKTPEDALRITKDIDFYGKDFLIERPILRALTCEKPCVLLIDEIYKASEELEYTLLEVLDEFSITIPQYGTVHCNGEPPMVFLTSNNYRELSDALKRRCNYLYLNRKTVKEMQDILIMKAGVDENVARGVANCIDRISKLSLKQTPSVSEAITWARYLAENREEFIAEDTLYMIAKNKSDMDAIVQSDALTWLSGLKPSAYDFA